MISRRELLLTATAGSLSLSISPAAAAEPVNDIGFHKIGGIDQWIAIQGQDARNPIILYLHGGPSEAQSPFLKEFLPWERDFTVVNWDQRGSGKTFGRNGSSTPDMTVEKLADDAAEIAHLVCNRFSQRKVILVGQSWGSFLGVHVIKRRPAMFYCFVGTGQYSSIAAIMADRTKWARQKATETGDNATLQALDKAASLTNEHDRENALAKAGRKYVVSAPDEPYATMVRAFLGKPPYPKGDVADYANGNAFSGEKFRGVMATMDLYSLGPNMPVPFFVVQGRDDRITGFDPAKAFFDQLQAPKKAFVAIDGGHFACFTNPDGFVGALCKHVRPLAS
ncbi:MAG TPA: alpha/beta hydrolase [Rhizomicrobium sp.]|nr:alpha/beta hydrolase [Rhizomicrobium sp.]